MKQSKGIDDRELRISELRDFEQLIYVITAAAKEEEKAEEMKQSILRNNGQNISKSDENYKPTNPRRSTNFT